MAIDRRRALALLATLPMLPALARTPDAPLLSAGWRDPGQWQAGSLGGPATALPERAHDIVADPRRPGEALVIARRPGHYLARIDWRRGRLLRLSEAEAGRSLFGHGVFSPDGRHFLTTENDEGTGLGRITVRDATTLRPLADWPSHGIGPHELLWLDQERLAVANGGILTLAETGRLKRNLAEMAPSLVLLDGRTGKLLAEYRLDDPKLSIRHLARAQDGTLAAALQSEAGPRPLLALLRQDRFRLADTPPELVQAMAAYGASVAANGNRFLLSCPKGGLVAEWDSEGHPGAQAQLAKPYGVTARHGDWLVSGEDGQLWRLAAGTLELLASEHFPELHWDNHLRLSVV
ncbi:DUF1513 domain-containing protein [Chitinimonas lacunae]|uniref:DUF1513 domain-containing protein n=1 Tax=Chitinimonas lacunae TaxID=1963018 RepID=A0ABV8MQY9_9NEIS